MAVHGQRVRRALTVAAAALVFVLLAGATYQGVATALEQREFPRPGGLISLGDHQLHIYCTGRGSPTVILEAPAVGLSAAWAEVQHRLSQTTRVCSYDRSGLGWSETGNRPFDPSRVPEELRRLLTLVDERGPFVVVGHGLGAAFARMYAARPDGAARALVLVDPPTSDAAQQKDVWIMPASPWLARAGVMRAGRILSSKADGLQGGGALQAFLNRPDHLSRGVAELSMWDETVRRAATAQPAPTTRIVTVDSGVRERIAFLTSPTTVDRVVSAVQNQVLNARSVP